MADEWTPEEAARHSVEDAVREKMGICDDGHVELDDSPETPDSQILTPTSPVKVICQPNGEVVEREKVREEESKS